MNSRVKLSAKDEKIAESIIAKLTTELIKARVIDPSNKTREQLLDEVINYLEQIGDGLYLVHDHTKDVLSQARAYKKEGKNSFACLFYAVWIEHTLNNIILSFARRMNFTDREIGEIIRDTSYRAKLSWLPRIFGVKPFANSQINKIIKLMEVRNSFVHYKWKTEFEQENSHANQVLSYIEKTVKYTQNYENKYVIGMSKRRVKNILKSA